MKFVTTIILLFWKLVFHPFPEGDLRLSTIKRNLISWSDGYMWNNNFMKAINSDKRSLIEDRLPNTNMLEWMCAYNEGQCDMVGRKTANPFCWKIEVLFDDDKKYEAVGKQHFPMKWDSLRYLIEDTTECTFRLR